MQFQTMSSFPKPAWPPAPPPTPQKKRLKEIFSISGGKLEDHRFRYLLIEPHLALVGAEHLGGLAALGLRRRKLANNGRRCSRDRPVVCEREREVLPHLPCPDALPLN